MPANENIKFIDYLKNFGYDEPDVSEEGVFRYWVNFSSVKSTATRVPVDFYYSSDSAAIIKIQQEVWNKNDLNAFVLATDNQTFIYNGKIKPQKSDPGYSKIHSFNYGLNNQSPDFPEILRKEKLDGGYFFEFFLEKRKKNREQEVDKDLLLNLIALRQDLLQVFDDGYAIHLLILRCLFLKYLEDRGIYDSGYLVNLLETGRKENLLKAFEEVGKINGDIFRYDSFSGTSIHDNYLPLLAAFFKTDYRSKQGLLFPYKFNFIPIQLISNVYEAFLNNAKKRGKGIYYTPKFVVDFMLSQTLTPQLDSNEDLSIFDPACGSGAFLVEGFRAIVRRKKAERDFDKKTSILENQIFGVDIDGQALQLAAFSLYLALLEGLEPEFIKTQIDLQSPILPILIGKNLIQGNSLVDENIFPNRFFNCIITNPPWGSIPDDKDEENQKEREAIAGKGAKGVIPTYQNVSDFQRSQAFLLRVKKWSSKESVFGLIVNNSIFLNENTERFRKDFLDRYRLITFLELSNLNKILFRKKSIGKVKNKEIKIGATEPCAILIFDNQDNKEQFTTYISPKLNAFSEALLLIQYCDRDIKRVKQKDLVEEPLLWRIFVNGGWDDYQLIKSRHLEKERKITIECRSGFQPKKNMHPIGKPDYRPIIHPSDIEQFYIKEGLSKFDWNQKLRRRPQSIFSGERIIFPVRPLKKDAYKLKAARIQNNEVFKHNILCVKILMNERSISDHLPFLGIFNSTFIGYYSYHIAMQWGKGDLKRSTFRNIDIENLPLPKIDLNTPEVSYLKNLVERLESEKQKPFSEHIETLVKQIDELVFNLYELTEFEKSIVREFYDINVFRKGEEANKVRFSDLEAYFQKFKKIFELVLEDSLTIEAKYNISKNLGAYMVFQIKEKLLAFGEIKKSNLNEDEILRTIKKNQLEQAFYSNRLSEQKTKVYETNRFFIIKSHFFRDWTIRQAINDANEEVKILIQEANI